MIIEEGYGECLNERDNHSRYYCSHQCRRVVKRSRGHGERPMEISTSAHPFVNSPELTKYLFDRPEERRIFVKALENVTC